MWMNIEVSRGFWEGWMSVHGNDFGGGWGWEGG